MNRHFLNSLVLPAQGTLAIYLHPLGGATCLPFGPSHLVWILQSFSLQKQHAKILWNIKNIFSVLPLHSYNLLHVLLMQKTALLFPSSLKCLQQSLQSLKVTLLPQMAMFLSRKGRFSFHVSRVLTLVWNTSHSVFMISFCHFSYGGQKNLIYNVNSEW